MNACRTPPCTHTQEDAPEHIPQVLARVAPRYLTRAYKITSWNDAEDFLEQLAVRTGKLGKGGEPDLNTTAKVCVGWLELSYLYLSYLCLL